MRKVRDDKMFSRADVARLMWESGRMDTLKHSVKSVSAIFDTILEICMAGNKVGISGFGVFEMTETKEKHFKNNYFTKGDCYIPKKRRFKFRQSDKLVKKINKPEE